MMARCPHCGSTMERRTRVIDDEGELLLLLRARPDRDVYKTGTGSWHYTNSGGDRHVIDAGLIATMVGKGILRPSYSNTNDAYHLGRTIDIERTMEARKAKGKTAPTIYIDDPAPSPNPDHHSDG